MENVVRTGTASSVRNQGSQKGNYRRVSSKDRGVSGANAAANQKPTKPYQWEGNEQEITCL